MKYQSKYEIYVALYEKYKLDKINEVDILNMIGIDIYKVKQYINEVESCKEVVV